MPVRFWLRSQAALYAVPLMLALAYYFLRSSLVDLGDNWFRATAIAGGVVVVTAPVGGALAAWEADRLRRGRVYSRPGARSMAVVVGWSLWPTVLACLVLQGAALALVWPAMADVPGLPEPRLALVTFAVTLGFVAVGFAVGRRIRPVLSVPLLLVGGWIALAYPAAMEPFWIRHLTGNLRTCCSTNQVPDARALIAPSLVALGAMAASGLVALRRRPGKLLVGAALMTVAAVLASAIGLVHGMGWQAAKPRTEGLRCAPERGVEICLWPEDEARREWAADRLVTAAHRLHAAGLPLPHRITEGPANGNESWNAIAAHNGTPVDVSTSIVSGLLPAPPPCARTQDYPGGAATPVIGAWLGLHAGLPESVLVQKSGQEGLHRARQVLKLSKSRQLAWFQQNKAAMRQCGRAPVTPGAMS
ncbi:hypothetical protein [Streptomyces sp. NPDC059009]|uniref:DUF7224 domain-containing protein n=1 Tax=Streptomyces sp. NPDC059009 TaxID=3346694 RepID=UPI00369A9C7C